MVVQKGEYKPGDLTVYVEIDSVLPERPEFEFLRPKNFRVKTMKLNAVTKDGVKIPIFSQGICFPVSILPGNVIDPDLPKDMLVGTDVTEFLGIKKYDEYGDETDDSESDESKSVVLNAVKSFLFRHRLTRPLASALFSKKDQGSTAFPSIVSKTDETRIQSLPHLLDRKDITLVGREKIDGQSGTFILKKAPKLFSFSRQKYEFIVCSRNKRIPVCDNSSYWRVAEKYKIESVLKNLIDPDDDWICLQGEVVGPKIQGNKYKLNDYDLYCFNLITPKGIVPCGIAEDDVAALGMKWVPLVYSAYKMPDSVEEVLKDATGQSALCGDVLREGIVFRNYEEGISFKAVSPYFLIKNDE